MSLRAWAQVPACPADRRTRSIPWGRLAAAPVIAALGPWARTASSTPAPASWLVALVGVGALIALATVRPWGPRLVVLGAAGAVAAWISGPGVGLWLALGLALAGWVCLDRPPAPSLPDVGDEALGPAVALSLVAAWRGQDHLALPLVLMATAWVIAVAAGRRPDRITRWSTVIGRAARQAAEVVLLTPLWLVAVLGPSALHHLFALDPLRTPIGPSGTVRRRRRDGHHPERLWADERTLDRLPRWYRFRSRLVAPLVVVGVLAGLVAVGWESSPDDGEVPAALAGAPWLAEYRETLAWYTMDGFDPLRFRRLADLSSPSINVRDGRRASWRPPDCACDRLQVWMYGGSTTFGLGQRDDHTIASEIARLAADDGMIIDVANRGVMADAHWNEAVRFAWDAQTAPPPDLVIFYDGVNELSVAHDLANRGRTGEDLPGDLSMEDLRDGIDGPRSLVQRFDRISRPPSAEMPNPTTPTSAISVATDAVRRYDRSRGLSRAIAADLGVPARWYWQPMVDTRRTPVEGEPVGSVDSVRKQQEMRDQLPPDVRDLTGGFDDVEEPVFYDATHTNELGARVVAEAIYRDLRPQLREQWQASGGGGR